MDGKKDHVVELDDGGYCCASCGGEVGESGNALDLDDTSPGTTEEVAESIKKQGNPLDATFASAVRRGLNSKMGAD